MPQEFLLEEIYSSTLPQLKLTLPEMLLSKMFLLMDATYNLLLFIVLQQLALTFFKYTHTHPLLAMMLF